MQGIKGQLLFLSQWIRRPRKVGAIAPSSPWLSNAIANQIDLSQPGYIIELGGGTGSLTQAILKAGVPHERLIVVENNPKLVKHLKKRFPKCRICHHDAQYVDELARVLNIDNVLTVVSGLPLLSLPKSVRDNIVKSAFNCLKNGGQFLQFTYGFKSPIPAELLKKFPDMKAKVVKRVFRNIPPAVIWRYDRTRLLPKNHQIDTSGNTNPTTAVMMSK